MALDTLRKRSVPPTRERVELTLDKLRQARTISTLQSLKEADRYLDLAYRMIPDSLRLSHDNLQIKHYVDILPDYIIALALSHYLTKIIFHSGPQYSYDVSTEDFEKYLHEVARLRYIIGKINKHDENYVIKGRFSQYDLHKSKLEVTATDEPLYPYLRCSRDRKYRPRLIISIPDYGYYDPKLHGTWQNFVSRNRKCY